MTTTTRLDVPMPEGTQPATVIWSTARKTSTGKDLYSIKWEDDSGRSAWQNIIISPESEKAMAFASKLAAVLGLPTTAFADPTAPEAVAAEIVGARALVTVEHENYSGKVYTKVRWLNPV